MVKKSKKRVAITSAVIASPHFSWAKQSRSGSQNLSPNVFIKNENAYRSNNKTHKNTFLKSLSLLVIMIFGLINPVYALPFNGINQIYFFGDSLSDSGFNDLLPGLPIGKAPSFTTFSGYTWTQYLAHDLKGYTLPVYPGPVPADTITNNSCCVIPGLSSGSLKGINYAAAGSRTNSPGILITQAPSLVTQVQTFLNTPGRSIQSNDIFFIWEGANDLLGAANPSDPPLVIFKKLSHAAKEATDNIANQIALLISKGAKRFVVLNLPDIGSTPYALSFGSTKLSSRLTQITFIFNSLLNQALGRIIQQYGIQILEVNTPSILTQLSSQFKNTTSPICGDLPSVACMNTSNGYLFADALHPTDMAHHLLAEQVKSLILNWA